MEVFKLIGTIIIDAAKAISDIDKTGEETEKTKEDVDGLGKETEKTESKMSKAFSKIGSAAVKLGKLVATGLAVGATAMAGLTAKAINLGGELEQNIGGSEAVYAEYAENMQDIAGKAYENMGLSTSDFLATANKMGALFQGAGFDIQESADLSAKAMQRAADVASIMGIDTTSAMEAVAGAAKGNFTMMDNLGVAMNETTLEAYVLSKGISKAYSEMSNQEKIGLAMQLFLEKTSYAAGNYAKENETLAGSLGTAKAALVNFMDGSGDVDSLVNALSNAGGVISDNLTQLLPRLVTGVTQLVEEIGPMLPPLLVEILPSLIEGGVALIQGLIAALPQILSGLLDALPEAFSGLPMLGELFAQIVPMLQDLFSQLMPVIEQLFTTLLPPLMQIIQMVLPVLMELITALLPVITPLLDLLQPILDLVIALLDPLIKILSAILPPIINVIEMCVDILVSLLKPAIEMITNTINLISPVLVSIGELFGSIWTNITEIWGKASDFFLNVVDAVKQPFLNIAEWFKNIFSSAWQKVKDVFSTGGKIFDGIKDGIANAFKTVVNGLITGINKVIAVPFNAINNMLKKIREVSVVGIKPFDWVSTFNVPEIPKLEKGAVLEKGQTGYLEGNGAEAVVPLEKNKKWIHALAEDMKAEFGGNFNTDAVIKKLDELIRAIQSIRIYLNGDVLVGELAPAMNSALGDISTANERGQ